MSKPMISVQDLGKRYILKHQTSGVRPQYQRLSEEISNGLKGLLKNKEKSQKINSREEFWALKGVSFDINEGEVVGIIGRNGAGKSTLLKLLSRITDPSKGRFELRGRVAALLEVGTGFHPELSGRENIFLNGAILGMHRSEIRSKFDEIVNFSGVEKFLDTPVKRYSSGMHMRLAFSVAAHLDPEILIVDEVLAVGDYEFQKKCLGKMGEVASSGRTVIFVSHNLSAVKHLTKSAIWLQNGALVEQGATIDVLASYLASMKQTAKQGSNQQWRGQHSSILSASVHLLDGDSLSSILPGSTVELQINIITDGTPNLSVDFLILDANYSPVAFTSLYQQFGLNLPSIAGTHHCRYPVILPELASGDYHVEARIAVANKANDSIADSIASFNIPFCSPLNSTWDLKQSRNLGNVLLRCPQAPTFTTIPNDSSNQLISNQS